MINDIRDLLDQWDSDVKIDRTEPGNALLDIPKLHAKYLRILATHKALLKAAEFKYNKTKKLKHEYYSGRLDEETLKRYGWEPFPFVLKSDISLYFDSDEDLNKAMANKTFHTDVIEICTAILKELNSRTYQLRSFIDYEKFIQGG